MDRLSLRAVRSYGELERISSSILGTEEGRDIYKIVKGVREGISDARRHLMSVKLDGSLYSCVNGLASMNKAYRVIEQALPSPQDSDWLAEFVISSHDNSEDGRFQNVAKKEAPFLGVLSAITLPYYLGSGETTPAMLSLGISAAAFSSRFFKRPYLNLILANLGFAATALYGGSDGHGLENMWVVGRYAVDVAAFVSAAYGLRVGGFAFDRWRFNSTVNKTRGVNLDQDRFVRLGVAINEGSRNLGYVSRVCKSEKRDASEFVPQTESFQKVLMRYLSGKASYDEVVSARIRYFPKPIERVIKSRRPLERQTSSKIGYTPEEYLAMKAQQSLAENGRDRKRVRVSVEQTSQPRFFVDETPDIHYALSPGLQEDYEEGKRNIQGYSIVTLMDTIRERIEAAVEVSVRDRRSLEHTPKISFIADRENLRIVNKNIKQKHSLPDDARLYKLDHSPTIRCIFTVNRGTVQLLEVLPHKDYDRLIWPT